MLPAEGTLAADSLVQAPRRTSATVSALMLSLAMVVSFGGFAHSFYTSVDEWMDTALNPDLFVAPSANVAARSLTFPSSVAQMIETVEGVDQVQLTRAARVPYRQIPVMIIAADTGKLVQKVRRVPISGNWDEMCRAAAEGKGLIASGSFAEIYQLKMGD